MELFPAIDIKNGRVVRLTQGDYGRVKEYGDDPLAVARSFAADGARNLHMVDLDGARDGAAVNEESIRRIARGVPGMRMQVGGGIRDQARIEQYLSLGVARVILGTVAVEDFAFVERMAARYKGRVAVSVDARDGLVATRGWRETSSLDALEFCMRLEGAGVRTVICTDISRDGEMQGSNMELYRTLRERIGCDIIASGGVSGVEEIAALRDMGLYGCIVGKALYEGALSLKELLAIC